MREPMADFFRERQLIEAPVQVIFFQLGLESGPVELGRLLGLHLVRGAALHELALDAVERGELAVAGGERAEFGLDAEQLRKKIVQMRRDLDDQRRFGLRIKVVSRARGFELRSQRGFRGAEMVQESGIEPDKAVAFVEFREGQAVSKLQHPVPSAPGAGACPSRPSTGRRPLVRAWRR